MRPGTEQAVERYAGAYRKARVKVQWRPGNYDQQTAALLTDSGPDVFEVNGPTLDQIQGGRVVDLTELVRGESAWTVQVARSFFTTSQVVRPHELFVVAVVSVLPLLLVFLCFQRWIVAGVDRSGID